MDVRLEIGGLSGGGGIVDYGDGTATDIPTGVFSWVAVHSYGEGTFPIIITDVGNGDDMTDVLVIEG